MVVAVVIDDYAAVVVDTQLIDANWDWYQSRKVDVDGLQEGLDSTQDYSKG